MPQLRPKSFGKVPDGLPAYHRDFLLWVKETLEIITGVKRSQTDTAAVPRSQAMTFQDLVDVPEYADNAAAKAAGRVKGDLYRTTDTLKVVHD